MAVSIIGPKFYAWDRCGKPLAFGKLYTYQARTNTPKPTYQSEDQQVENTNPVILNGEGYANVYLDGSYKMVLKDKDENEIWSADPVTSATADEWTNCFSAVYASSTSFKIFGNQTAEYRKDRKVRIDNNVTEYSYSTIVSSNYANGETTVVVFDAVVSTNVGGVCTSITSSESSFSNKDVGYVTDFVFKNDSSGSAVDNMIAGRINGEIIVEHKEGNVYSTGGTTWKAKGTNQGNETIADFSIVSSPKARDFITDFGSDSSSQVQSCIDAAGNGLTHLPPLQLLSSAVLKDGGMTGEGSASTLQSPSTDPVLLLKQHSPDWDYRQISDFQINGGGDSNGVEFDPDNALSGRKIFKNMSFRDCLAGSRKPSGNIGDAYYDCHWARCDYGVQANGVTATPIDMHSGVTSINNSYLENIYKAAYYVDDPIDGQGGWNIRDSIMERVDGFGVFMKCYGITPYTPAVFENLWFEKVARSETVDIGGTIYTPKEMRLEGVKPAIIKESYLKTVELIDSVLVADRCRIDDVTTSGLDISVDDDSIMIANDVYAAGQIGSAPFVTSILNQTNVSINTNCSVRGPWKKNQINLANVTKATNIASNSFSGSGPWGFPGTTTVNATSVADGVLNDSCAEMTIPNGNTNLDNLVGTPTVGKYVVWGIHAKLMSGSLPTARIGENWRAGNIYLTQDEWVCSYGIKKASSPNTTRLYFINNTGAPCTIRLADYFCVEFDTFKEAIEFVNSGYAIKNEV